MALVACPDCEKHVSDSAPSCIHCGRPMRTGTEVAAQTAPVRVVSIGETAIQRSAFACPRCGSEDTRKFSVIWRDGIQHINTRTAGVGLAGGHLGVGGAQTKGQAQSASSMNTAPPQKKSEMGLVWGIILGLLGMLAVLNPESRGFGLILLGGAGVAVWVAHPNGTWNKTVHPQLYRRWDNSYRCNRCENMYVLGA